MKKLLIIALVSFLILPTKHLTAQNQEEVIDKIVAVVGNNIIMYSDIENKYMQYLQQGYTSGSRDEKCQILEELLFEKLLLNQAQIDSIVISDNQVEDELDRRIRYFISQLGSQEKLEEYYQKSILEIKDEFKGLIKDQLKIQQVESKITQDIKVTPSDVTNFFNSFPEDSLPLINSELEIGQIIKQPAISEEEKTAIKEKLNELRERIIKGENFATLAVLYSEDAGSAKKGGELGMYGRGDLYPEFEAVAFNLKDKEVSPIVETKAGFHIIQLIERKGEYVNVRHILLQPKVQPMDLLKAKESLDSIILLIKSDSITFKEAAHKFSDEPVMNDEGLIVNPQTGTAKFEPDEIESSMFFVIDKMEAGNISEPVIMKQPDGKQAYRILYLKSRTKPHKASLKEDYNHIQEAALADKKNEAVNKWIQEKIKQNYIKIDDDYTECNFTNNWIN